ncbi:TetR/AcrR family transcriptional regulator [Pseudonocardia spinosispora]|uniref:TetR/AcrR family transcriptional regulator n=1 Tax=Pseudonocardia spinosispora TaxID=103441 RepID=UPI00048FD229|nr:TetR/AcrR family transcriptional regulator [Pseudonocardia spinosispora]
MNPRERRAARHLPPEVEATDGGPVAKRTRRGRAPITVDQVVDTALRLVATEGYDALTMRRVAAALDASPASLYVHVVNKADLDELLIGRLCAQIVLPDPDPARWRDQIRDVCAQLRELYLRYPGISRAAMAMAPTNLEMMRVGEGMLAIVLAGGVEPRVAAWTTDAMALYVNAYCLEASIVRARSADGDEWVLSREEMISRMRALPPDTFPHTRRHAEELTEGEGHDRFDFTLSLMIENLGSTTA